MENLNILFANIFDLKDEISSLSWNCCSQHTLNIEFALNLDELISKLRSGKKYHGLILGQSPEGAKYSGIQILYRVREEEGYESFPAVILLSDSREYIDDIDHDTKKILFVPVKELKRPGKITEIMHEHFLGLNK